MSHLRDGIRIVVASEPRSYREALAGVLSAREPQGSVVAADPSALHETPEVVAGALVLCNEVTGPVSQHAAGWIRLAPDGALDTSSVPEVNAMSGPGGLDAVGRAVDRVRSVLAQV